ncbi:hypothetical protein AaE_003066, partial [Aphanomyces astaci]
PHDNQPTACTSVKRCRTKVDHALVKAIDATHDKGLSVTELMAALFPHTSTPRRRRQQLQEQLDQLVADDRVCDVHAFDCVRYVDTEHAKPWFVYPFTKDAATNAIEFQRDAPVMARPWLKMDGEVNDQFLVVVKRELTMLVVGRPGIGEQRMCEYFKGLLGLQDVRNLCFQLIDERVLYCRAIERRKQCGLFGGSNASEAPVVGEYSMDRHEMEMHYFPAVDCFGELGNAFVDMEFGSKTFGIGYNMNQSECAWFLSARWRWLFFIRSRDEEGVVRMDTDEADEAHVLQELLLQEGEIDDELDEDDEMDSTSELSSQQSAVETSDVAAATTGASTTWNCTRCTYENSSSSSICEICGSPREVLDSSSVTPSSAATASAAGDGRWECAACTLLNPRQAHVCTVCSTPNPASMGVARSHRGHGLGAALGLFEKAGKDDSSSPAGISSAALEALANDKKGGVKLVDTLQAMTHNLAMTEASAEGGLGLLM